MNGQKYEAPPGRFLQHPPQWWRCSSLCISNACILVLISGGKIDVMGLQPPSVKADVTQGKICWDSFEVLNTGRENVVQAATLEDLWPTSGSEDWASDVSTSILQGS